MFSIIFLIEILKYGTNSLPDSVIDVNR